MERAGTVKLFVEMLVIDPLAVYRTMETLIHSEDVVSVVFSPFAIPKTGLCEICAFEKEIGIFNTKNGACICVECRDKARK